jgi:hypothetical protein
MRLGFPSIHLRRRSAPAPSSACRKSSARRRSREARGVRVERSAPARAGGQLPGRPPRGSPLSARPRAEVLLEGAQRWASPPASAIVCVPAPARSDACGGACDCCGACADDSFACGGACGAICQTHGATYRADDDQRPRDDSIGPGNRRRRLVGALRRQPRAQWPPRDEHSRARRSRCLDRSSAGEPLVHPSILVSLPRPRCPIELLRGAMGQASKARRDDHLIPISRAS